MRPPSVNYAGSLGGQRTLKRKAKSFRFCASESGAECRIQDAANSLSLGSSEFWSSIEVRF